MHLISHGSQFIFQISCYFTTQGEMKSKVLFYILACSVLLGYTVNIHTTISIQKNWQNHHDILSDCVTKILQTYLRVSTTIIVLQMENNMLTSTLTERVDNAFITINVRSEHSFFVDHRKKSSSLIHHRENMVFVVILRKLNLIQYVINSAKKLPFWNPRLKFVVILSSVNYSTQAMQTLFETCLEESILNMILLVRSNDDGILPPINPCVNRTMSIFIFSYHPFLKHNSGEVKVILMDKWKCNTFQFGVDLFPNKVLNLHKHPLYLTSAHVPPNSIIEQNADGTLNLNGWDGKVLQTLTEKLNFTLILKYVNSY